MPKANGTTARGYGTKHQQLRKQWAKVIAAGQGYCHAITCTYPTRYIPPGAAWDLGHNQDRTRWTGPEHARCNRSDGGRRRLRGAQTRSWDI
jgi:hypothetical protein